MKLLVRIGIGLLALVVGFVGIGFVLPRQVAFERSIDIDRPAATLSAVLQDFGAFNAWSPWADLDPAAVYAFEGPIRGPGAVMRWTSENPSVGNGEMKLVEVSPEGRIEVALGFGGSTADAFYAVAPQEGGGVRVIWGFSTDMGDNPIGRWFGLALPSMVGKDYDRGLAGLKTYAEGLPAADFAGLTVERAELPPANVAYVNGSAPPDAVDLAAGAALERVRGELTAAGMEAAGRPILIPTGVEADGRAGFRVALGYRGPAAADTTGASTGFTRLPASSALTAPVRGDLAAAEVVVAQLEAYAAAHRDALAAPARIAVQRTPEGGLRALWVALPIAPAPASGPAGSPAS